MTPEFLDVDDVLTIHEVQIRRFGGSMEVRDRSLLDSAVAQPMATFGGEFLHGDLFRMAAAYLFHIAKNHTFVDGNKRTALAAALTFLDINGHPIMSPTAVLDETTRDVVEGRAGKDDVAAVFRRLAAG